jgi:hypothetical protein
MADTPESTRVDDAEVRRREREKLDVGDSHPESRELMPDEEGQGEGTDVGDPKPHDRDALPADPGTTPRG